MNHERATLEDAESNNSPGWMIGELWVINLEGPAGLTIE